MKTLLGKFHVTLFLTIGLLLATGIVSAQETKKAVQVKTKTFARHLPIFSYSMGTTMGDSADFVQDYSWAGFSLEYRYRILKEFSVGAQFGANTFSDKKSGTFTKGTTSVTGTQIRAMETMPLTLLLHYYPITLGKGILPIVGFELGGYYKWRYVDAGWWANSEDNWHFGIAPQLGINFPIKEVSLAVNVKWNYLVKAGDHPSEMYWTFNLGIALPI